MPIHDVYARLTPYEIAFPGRRFVDERFRRLADSAGEVDLHDPGAFAMLAGTGEIVQELVGEGVEPDGSTQTRAVVFHGFHFWSAGEPLYLAAEDRARAIVREASELGAAPGTGWPTPAHAAGYLQWPRNLFWTTAAAAEGVPEPVDGFFWASAPDGTLSLLLVVGLRRGRGGFGAIHIPSVGVDELTVAVGEPGREGEPEFSPTGLPGAELEGLHGIETAIEAVKLAAGAFRRMPEDPGEPRPGVGASGDDDGEESGEDGEESDVAPVPSGLPWWTLTRS